MVEDWIKVGDVISYTADELDGWSLVTVLQCTDTYMVTLRVELWVGHHKSEILFERSSDLNWNKRSHWKRWGWKFL